MAREAVIRSEGLERDPEGWSYSIVMRLRARDGSALRELFQSEGRRAFTLALRVVGGDAATAEDVVQEAFSQVWERADRIDPAGGRLGSLLMTIVHRRAIDYLRRRDRDGRSLPDAALLDRIDEEAMAMLDRVEESLSSSALRAGLRAALDGLPPEQRAIVDHVYVHDRSLPEIAAAEGLPLGTVKSRLRLAMAKLTQSVRGETSR